MKCKKLKICIDQFDTRLDSTIRICKLSIIHDKQTLSGIIQISNTIYNLDIKLNTLAIDLDIYLELRLIIKRARNQFDLPYGISTYWKFGGRK